MKLFILALLIPCQLFCCQDCVERIEHKMDWTLSEIVNEVNKGKHRNKPYINFLYGKYEAYYECLHLIEHQGS